MDAVAISYTLPCTQEAAIQTLWMEALYNALHGHVIHASVKEVKIKINFMTRIAIVLCLIN